MSSRVGLAVLGLVCSAALGLGCADDTTKKDGNGGDSGAAGQDSGNVGEDASMVQADAAVGTDASMAADSSAADAATQADAGDAQQDAGPADTFVTNTPKAKFTNLVDSQGILTLVGSNFLQSPSGGQFFQQWYGELMNVGTDTICLPSVQLTFKDSHGATLASHLAYADAPAYDTGSTLSTACVAPGVHAGLYSNDFAATLVDPADIAEVVVSWDGILDNTAVPHPLAPTLVSSMVKVNTFVSGTYRNDATAIYNVSIDVYPRGSDGLLFDKLSDFHLDTLLPAAEWNFETLATQQPFSEYLQTVDFIEGVKP